MPKIFPQSAAGQSMRWSKFKNDDSRRIFDVMSQRVFPAIKSMKYGRLPDFNEKGGLVEIEDEPGKKDESTTAFARYMSNAMFLIPTPQLLQKIITGLTIFTKMTLQSWICRATSMSICLASWHQPVKMGNSAHRSTSAK